ncbi:hypothetical protein BofuT4_uP129460.1 [Botrytis cinerea T4]|uniref:Secreted protein n=1 Tax=Botryotinia fuckeliana (strain T4) TaxID=999810 RepID=G2YRJ8_BOTF4|nr:hypothetical protein BofuT4_uP129460.1 [Botrytis cinerea T4]
MVLFCCHSTLSSFFVCYSFVTLPASTGTLTCPHLGNFGVTNNEAFGCNIR